MHWRIEQAVNASRQALHHTVRRKAVRVHRERGMISFTFDDFPRSACTRGREILETHGVCGTFYASLGLSERHGPEEPYFKRSDLEVLVQRGHEVGCHTYGHTSMRRLADRDIRREIENNAKAIAELIPDYALRTFAYPRGAVTVRAKRALGANFVCCRGTEDGINAGVTDLNLLRANKIYTRRGNMDDLLGLIQENRRIGGWLVFYTHDVRDEPSPYGCTQEDLETVVRAATASGSDVFTVRNAIGAIAFSI